jgi:hypothetical protein
MQLRGKAASFDETRPTILQVDEARWTLPVHRTDNPRAASVDFARRLIEMLETGLHVGLKGPV